MTIIIVRMAKELIFHEDFCTYLDILSTFSPTLVDECCAMSLEILDNNKHLSPKLLSKASAKLNVNPDQLEKCLEALATLFLEATKQLKSFTRVLTSLEMLRIPHAERLTRFWSEEVKALISMHQKNCF